MTAAVIGYAEWVLRPPIPESRTPTRHSYFICSTPRIGSWLLCGLLASTGVAGRPHEWFWRGTEEANTRAWGASGLADYVRLVHQAGTTPNGVFGAKLMWAHAEHTLFRLRALGQVGSDQVVLVRHFPNPRFVWVRRDDVAAQAVSWAKAIQTGHWHHWDTPRPNAAPRYNREQIDVLAREAITHNAAWSDWFAANEIDPLVVRFEDLVANPAEVTREVVEFLCVASNGLTVAELTISAHDHVNEEWLARYRTRPR